MAIPTKPIKKARYLSNSLEMAINPSDVPTSELVLRTCPECDYHSAWDKQNVGIFVNCLHCFYNHSRSLEIFNDIKDQVATTKDLPKPIKEVAPIPHSYPEIIDFSTIREKITVNLDAIAFADKEINCDLLIKQRTKGIDWKSLEYPEMLSLLTYLELIHGIASSLKSLEYQTKTPSGDRLSKFVNYVSTKTGEIYPHWSAMPEHYLHILKQKISEAIAGAKAA